MPKNYGRQLRAEPVPAAPLSAAREYLFLDEADGHLKSINHDGDVTDLETGGGGGSGTVLVATTLLTSAQILAMHDTPVEVVPAPGVGKAVAVINIAAVLAFATTAYETGEDLDVVYDGGAITLAPAAFIGFFTADASGGGEFATGPSSGEFVGLLTAVENKAIVATCITANPENGDSDVLVTILYAVVDLA